MPPNTVYVGRGTKWGNPFIVGDLWENQGIDRRLAVRLFRYMLQGVPSFAAFMFSTSILKNRLEILENIHELRGKNLACWCPLDQPCHADVLLELANK